MKQPPRTVLHVITRLDLGGSAESMLLTIIGMIGKGYRVHLVSGATDNAPGAYEQQAVAMGLTISRCPFLVRNIAPVHDALALVWLYAHMRVHRYDLVHTNTSKAGILGRAAAQLAGCRAIIHTPHGHIFYGYFAPWLTRFFVALERAVMPCTHTLIALTQAEKRDYLERGIGPAKKIVPVFSGIDFNTFMYPARTREQMRTELGLSNTAFVIGNVARLVPIKNHGMIVNAAPLLKEAVPGLKFVFVGDGELRGPLEAQIRALDVEELFLFTGWRSDVNDLLAAFDAFALTSKNEGMGRVFVEAQAAGLPVVGTRVGGIPEVLDNGVTGFLVEPDNPRDLADKIIMLHNRRVQLPDMAADCKAWVNPRFGKEAMWDATDSIYREALRGADR